MEGGGKPGAWIAGFTGVLPPKIPSLALRNLGCHIKYSAEANRVAKSALTFTLPMTLGPGHPACGRVSRHIGDLGSHKWLHEFWSELLKAAYLLEAAVR